MEDLEGALSLLTGDLIGALSLLKGDLTLKNDFHKQTNLLYNVIPCCLETTKENNTPAGCSQKDRGPAIMISLKSSLTE